LDSGSIPNSIEFAAMLIGPHFHFMTDLKRIKRALISVSDKTGIVEFAKVLRQFDVEIISTGGTANALRDAGIDVTDVSEVTGFPEMMDGRVKTLHPKIHGGLLALRDNTEHLASMSEHGIEPIDMVVVNLYPFEQTIAKEGVTLEEAIENIDIGGPAMIRSASKNYHDVAVITDKNNYAEIAEELKSSNGSISLKTRKELAARAYRSTSVYDDAISSFLSEAISESSEPSDQAASQLPGSFEISIKKATDLRYGENPHQKAALYTDGAAGIANSEQLHGKEMSYNNYVDTDAAWALVNDFDELAVAIIKHTNPSGVGVGATNEEAYRRALATDPASAFGGIVAFNRKVDAQVAASVNEVFTEVVLAPDYDDHALEIFKTKKNLRVLRIKGGNLSGRDGAIEYKQISGGFLVQDADLHRLKIDEVTIVTERQPTDTEIRAMLFAWNVCKHVKSNAIVLANENQTLGVGAGQMNRVDSIRIAGMRAERFSHDLKGAALASDAFFPFRDNVDEAAKLDISAIIQPGGSIKDEESITAANKLGITIVFTGLRHFKH
jgi:phosphoribosylaminoimidazolecarboxamide formyltransferase/IMP cyclohydrolase